MTTGQDAHPSESAKYLGKSLSEDVVRRCLACHVTSARAILAGSGPGATDHGIGCEKCHGPGENHVLAVKARFPDLAIIDPRMASGRGVVTFCGECHSRDDASPNDPLAARFQAKTLPYSRCFIESQDKLDCITCHDPHRNAATSMLFYEAKCLSCHTGPALLASPRPGQLRRVCPKRLNRLVALSIRRAVASLAICRRSTRSFPTRRSPITSFGCIAIDARRLGHSGTDGYGAPHGH